MKKILVAGATRYLGKFVVKELRRRGHWIRALARDAARLKPVEGDVDLFLADTVISGMISNRYELNTYTTGYLLWVHRSVTEYSAVMPKKGG